MSKGTRVWDLPTRLFHWALVGLLGFSWWSAENREMEWHLLSGVALLGLLVFRLVWGVIGGRTARFSSFVRSPGSVLNYMKNGLQAAGEPGHNPLGGYSVIAMLAVLGLQVGTGLFATDIDGLDSGHLSFLVSFDQGRAAAEWHEVIFNILLGLAVLHILAIMFYLFMRERNLVRTMITGVDPDLDKGRTPLASAGWTRLSLAILLASALAWWTSSGFGL